MEVVGDRWWWGEDGRSEFKIVGIDVPLLG